MKKKICFSALISLLLTLLFCYIPASFTPDRTVVDIAASPSGLICLVQESNSPSASEWRLTEVDATGAFLRDKRIADSDEDILYRQCIADDRGYVYVLVEEEDEKDPDAQPRQYVKVYDQNFEPVQMIFQAEPIALEEARQSLDSSVDLLQYDPKIRWKLNSLQYLNGDVLAVQVKDLTTVDLRIYHPEQDAETACTYRFAEPVYIEEIIADGGGGLYLTDLQSRLYHVLPDGEIRAIGQTAAGIPYRLSIGDAGKSLYFSDIRNNAFLRYDSQKQESEVLYHSADKLPGGVPFADVRKLRVQGSALLAYCAPAYSQQNQRFAYLQDADGQARRILLEKSAGDTRRFDLDESSALLFALLFAVLLYAWHFSRRLLLKTAAFLSALIIAVSLSVPLAAESALHAFLAPYFRQQLYVTASILSQRIPPADLAALAEYSRSPDSSEACAQKLREIHAVIHAERTHAQESADEPKNRLLESADKLLLEKAFYVTLYYTLAGEPYVAADLNPASESNPRNASARYLIGDDFSRFFKAEKHVNAALTEAKYDIKGAWTASVVPIYDQQRQPVGYVEVGLRNEDLTALLYLLKIIASALIALTVFLCLLAILLVVRNALRALRKLQKGVEQIAAGNLDTAVQIHSGDEFETISNAFNQMAWKMKTHTQEILDYSAACQRFIPFGLFAFLGRKSILDVRLGDQGAADLHILSIQAVENRASGDDPFALLNRIFSVMAGEIGRSGGIIENYYGAGLRAIYTGPPDDAIAAALRIIESIRLSSDLDAQIYAALVRGKTTIGIVGDEQRLETTILSDTVQQLEALEVFGRKYQARLLLTQAARESLQQKDRFALREVGRLRAFFPAAAQDAALTDCLDAYPPAQKKGRQLVKSLFEQAVAFYAASAFREARKTFIDVMRRSGEDELAKAYLFLCDDHLSAQSNAQKQVSP